MSSASIYKSPAGQRAIMAFYDAVLARWPVPHQTRALPTRHGSTFVISSGAEAAPPLVLLHGAGSNAVAWVGDVAQYSRHFRTHAVDIPGEPGKSAQHRAAWDGPAYAEWLEDVLDGLGAPAAALLGISQGGWTALKFATWQPERVSRLALLTPGGVAPARTWFLLRAIALSMLGRPGAEAINRIVLGRQPLPAEAVRYMDMILTHFRPRIGAQPLFSDDDLARLTMPVLLLLGARDAILPTEKIAARLGRLLPNLTALMLADKEHVLHNTAAQVLPFLLGPGAAA